MFWSFLHIIRYIFSCILKFFLQKYWKITELCAVSGGAKKNSPTADMIPAEKWLKQKNSKRLLKLKVFPIQWPTIFEKYQELTKWRSFEKKNLVVWDKKNGHFLMPNWQFSTNQKDRRALYSKYIQEYSGSIWSRSVNFFVELWFSNLGRWSGLYLRAVTL